MTELKKLMKFRENIHHFKPDDPGKQKIQQMLQDAHDLVPVKNNLWAYHIDVYGPQHKEEKELVALQTVTGYEKKAFQSFPIDEQQKIYKEWKEARYGKEHKPNHKGFSFNHQVTAPYLLVYCQKPGYPTEKQLKTKCTSKFKTNLITYSDNEQWMIPASMHGYGMTLLAAEQGLHASFCKCYYHSYNNFTNILSPLKHGWKNVAFLLGIGYKDTDMPYYNSKNKPDLDEVVTWK